MSKVSKIAVTRALRLSGTSVDITKIFAYARQSLGRAVRAFTNSQKKPPQYCYCEGLSDPREMNQKLLESRWQVWTQD